MANKSFTASELSTPFPSPSLGSWFTQFVPTSSARSSRRSDVRSSQREGNTRPENTEIWSNESTSRAYFENSKHGLQSPVDRPPLRIEQLMEVFGTIDPATPVRDPFSPETSSGSTSSPSPEENGSLDDSDDALQSEKRPKVDLRELDERGCGCSVWTDADGSEINSPTGNQTGSISSETETGQGDFFDATSSKSDNSPSIPTARKVASDWRESQEPPASPEASHRSDPLQERASTASVISKLETPASRATGSRTSNLPWTNSTADKETSRQMEIYYEGSPASTAAHTASFTGSPDRGTLEHRLPEGESARGSQENRGRLRRWGSAGSYRRSRVTGTERRGFQNRDESPAPKAARESQFEKHGEDAAFTESHLSSPASGTIREYPYRHRRHGNGTATLGSASSSVFEAARQTFRETEMDGGGSPNSTAARTGSFTGSPDGGTMKHHFLGGEIVRGSQGKEGRLRRWGSADSYDRPRVTGTDREHLHRSRKHGNETPAFGSPANSSLHEAASTGESDTDQSGVFSSPASIFSSLGSPTNGPFIRPHSTVDTHQRRKTGPLESSTSRTAAGKAVRNAERPIFESTASKPGHSTSPSPGRSEDVFRTPVVPAPSARTAMFKTPARNFPSSARVSATPARTPKTPAISRTPRARPTPKFTFGTGGPAKDHVITAIVQGRGYAKSEVGMASINLVTSKLTLCQLTDTSMYSKTIAKLNVFNSVEVLMPDTMVEPKDPAELALKIHYVFPSVCISSVERKFFNENCGLEKLMKLSSSAQNAEILPNAQKYYMLAATGALLAYIETVCSVFYAPKSLAVEYQGAENTVTIDVDTAFRLELVTNTHEGKAGPSLLSTLKHCQIPSGARLLRSSILEPSRDLKLINIRHEAVEELLSNPDLFYSIKAILPRFAQLECTLSLCCHAPEKLSDKILERRINCVVWLKQNLELLDPLKKMVEPAKSKLFVELKNELSKEYYKEILTKISLTLHPDACVTKDKVAMTVQRCYAIQTGVDTLLDCVRGSLVALVREIEEYAKEIMEKYQHLPITIDQYANLGYHLQLPKPKKGGQDFEIPPEFIVVQKARNRQSFTTRQLASLNQRVATLRLQIEVFTLRVLEGLISSVVDQIRQLHTLSDSISHLDLVVSLAHAAAVGNYQKPEFKNLYLVKESRHPILERSSEDPVIPNDIMLSVSSNFQLITGANMSGKSVFIRQVALIQILAQVGSFVPASSAVLPLVDQVFSRLGSNDSIESGASSFQVELMDMNYIMTCATENSLVIVDELCKETAFDEGSSLSWSFAEALLEKKSWVLYTTHFSLLTKLADVYFNVTNWHMEVIEAASEDDVLKLHFTYKMKPGVVEIGRYGLKAAAAARIPSEILKEAEEFVEEMENTLKEQSEKGAPEVEPRRRREKVDFLVYQRLVMLASSVGRAPPDELTRNFIELQEFYAKQLQEL